MSANVEENGVVQRRTRDGVLKKGYGVRSVVCALGGVCQEVEYAKEGGSTGVGDRTISRNSPMQLESTQVDRSSIDRLILWRRVPQSSTSFLDRPEHGSTESSFQTTVGCFTHVTAGKREVDPILIVGCGVLDTRESEVRRRVRGTDPYHR